MKKIVIKVGSSTLTQGTEHLSRRFMLNLVQQIAELKQMGIQVVLVSSGAVATGKELLGNASFASKQLFASIGQVKLIHTWAELFALFDLQVGQLLVTKEDIVTLGDTLNHLLEHVVPIVNENDPVGSSIGDNDNLAAHLANIIHADTVILLTDQEGLYTADPRFDPEAKLISLIQSIDEGIVNSAKGPSSLGTGGMATKVQAAERGLSSGIRTIIASSARPNVLLELAQGKNIGTMFHKEVSHE